MRARLTALAVCGAIALLAGGCTSDDEQGVRDTVAKLERALRAGDAEGVCRLYARGVDFCLGHFRSTELRSIGFGGRIEVVGVEVDGRRAVAYVENVRGRRRVAGSTTLRKVGDRWLLGAPRR